MKTTLAMAIGCLGLAACGGGGGGGSDSGAVSGSTHAWSAKKDKTAELILSTADTTVFVEVCVTSGTDVSIVRKPYPITMKLAEEDGPVCAVVDSYGKLSVKNEGKSTAEGTWRTVTAKTN